MADLTVPKQGDAWLNKDTRNLKYHLENINYTIIPQGWFVSGEIIEKPGYVVSISDVEWKPLNPGKIYKTDSEHVFKAIGIALNACNSEEPIEIQRDGLYHYDEINWPVAPFNTSDIGKTAYVSVSPDGQITTDITLATIGNNNVITVGQIISERDIDLSFSGDGRGPTDYSEIEYTTGEEIDVSSTPVLVSLKDDGFVYKSNKQSALNRYNVVGFIVGSELGLTILPIGTKVIVRRLGLLNGFSGLTPGLPIYASGDNNLITYGTITQHPESISVYYDKVVAIGIANSSSQIVVSILPAYSKNDDNIIGVIIMCDSTKTEPDT
ncbi:MAG TPA: hypothetical protein PKI46_09120, partial [Bacteroidales bacterium]|nr:hypothetical protein [Bacteroidales bacterium]